MKSLKTNHNNSDKLEQNLILKQLQSFEFLLLIIIWENVLKP